MGRVRSAFVAELSVAPALLIPSATPQPAAGYWLWFHLGKKPVEHAHALALRNCSRCGHETQCGMYPSTRRAPGVMTLP